METTPDLRLRPAFVPCVHCGVLVLVRVWSHGTGWRELAAPVTCVLGEPHRCTEQPLVWQEVLTVREKGASLCSRSPCS